MAMLDFLLLLGYLPCMIRSFFILLPALLLLSACEDQGVVPRPEPREPYVPGVVVVLFADGTTLQQAEQFISGLGLSFEHGPVGSPLISSVKVPVGTEDAWVTRLKTYPVVKNAERSIYLTIQ